MLNNLEQAALHAFRAGDSSMTSAAPLSGAKTGCASALGIYWKSAPGCAPCASCHWPARWSSRATAVPRCPRNMRLNNIYAISLQPIAPIRQRDGRGEWRLSQRGRHQRGNRSRRWHLGAGQSQHLPRHQSGFLSTGADCFSV